jgi:predicted ArsR family transcriptional regulator
MTPAHEGPRLARLCAVRDNRTLSTSAKLAYATLALYEPGEHPSVTDIAAAMSVSRTTALKALRDLEAARAIRVTGRRKGRGSREVNTYELLSLAHLASASGEDS